MILLKILGFIFSWIAPFGVIYVNHVILEETQYNVDMIGLLIIVALVIGFIKYIDGRVEKWDYRNEHKIFRLNWNNGKKVFMLGILVWSLFTIEDNLTKLQWSSILILISFILGWLFTLLGNLKSTKKV